MKKLFTLFFISFNLSLSAQTWSILSNDSQWPTIKYNTTPSIMLSDGTYTGSNLSNTQIAADLGITGTILHSGLIFTISNPMGYCTTLDFNGGYPSDPNIPNTTNSHSFNLLASGVTTNLVLAGCAGGVTTAQVCVVFDWIDGSGNLQSSGNLVCQNITVTGEWPVGSGNPSPGDYCSFQLTPASYSSCPIYGGNVLEFQYGSLALTNSTSDCPNDQHGVPYYIAPGPQASFYSYTIDQGWNYAYTNVPNEILVLPPNPVTPPYQAYSAHATLIASGSGSAIGNNNNCVTSYDALPIQVDYPTDSPTHIYINPNATPIFNHATQLAISSQTGLYDLKMPGYINLAANLTSDNPNYFSIDWYEVDNTGKQTLVAQNTKSITVKVAGDYIAKANLAQGATVNPATGAPQNYSGSTYYIAQSNIAEVYNSSSSTANVDSMSVYPNPVCGTMHVNYLLSGKVTSATLTITNVSTGAVALQENLYITQQTQSVNISTLANGTYVATIQVNGTSAGSSSQTFVIMCSH